MNINMKKGKIIANKGVERNKKPLKNLIFNIEIVKELDEGFTDGIDYEPFKFKDLGYLFLYWKFQNDTGFNFHGTITPDELKKCIGEKQWSKFCQGKREFIIQRRVNGNNIPKK